MYILSVNISHHPSSCLLKDGVVQYFIEEERLNKTKNSRIETQESIRTKSNVYQTVRNGFQAIPYVKHVDHLIFASYGSPGNDPRRMHVVKNALADHGVTFGKTHYDMYRHHIYHASNAFYMSGMDNAIAIVKDGSGAPSNRECVSREIQSIYDCSYNGINELEQYYSGFNRDSFVETIGHKTYTNHLACGWIFSRACEMFGFNNSGADAGKLMGMAAYGQIESDVSWYKEYKGHYLTDNSVVYNEMHSVSDTFDSKANFAAKLQQESCNHTMYTIQKVIDKYNPNNIVLSGGYFMNCVNNYKYVKKFPDINFFVDPIAFDCGTALGAAKYLWYNTTGSQTKHPHSIYLGLN